MRLWLPSQSCYLSKCYWRVFSSVLYIFVILCLLTYNVWQSFYPVSVWDPGISVSFPLSLLLGPAGCHFQRWSISQKSRRSQGFHVKAQSWVGRGKETSKSGGATWASYSWFVLWYLASPPLCFYIRWEKSKDSRDCRNTLTTIPPLYSLSHLCERRWTWGEGSKPQALVLFFGGYIFLCITAKGMAISLDLSLILGWTLYCRYTWRKLGNWQGRDMQYLLCLWSGHDVHTL